MVCNISELTDFKGLMRQAVEGLTVEVLHLTAWVCFQDGHFGAVCSWASYLTSLSFSFLNYKMKIIVHMKEAGPGFLWPDHL